MRNRKRIFVIATCMVVAALLISSAGSVLAEPAATTQPTTTMQEETTSPSYTCTVTTAKLSWRTVTIEVMDEAKTMVGTAKIGRVPLVRWQRVFTVSVKLTAGNADFIGIYVTAKGNADRETCKVIS